MFYAITCWLLLITWGGAADPQSLNKRFVSSGIWGPWLQRRPTLRPDSADSTVRRLFTVIHRDSELHRHEPCYRTRQLWGRPLHMYQTPVLPNSARLYLYIGFGWFFLFSLRPLKWNWEMLAVEPKFSVIKFQLVRQTDRHTHIHTYIHIYIHTNLTFWHWNLAFKF
jgi:hypothetical protein